MTRTQTGTVLLTGFAPFDGRTTNASWAAVQEVAGTWTGPPELVVVRLPVSFRGARQVLREAVAEHSPALVVCVGEAAGRSAVGLERVAVNLIDAPIPDNDGSAPVDVPVIAGGPTAFLTTLPVRACLAAAQELDVPVEVSTTAGTYVCNATFYALMHLLDRTPAVPTVRGGFVHVPCVREQVRVGEPSLPTPDAASALSAILRAALDPASGAEPRRSVGTVS
ncbi:hypothetical protein [Cellulomonas sp. KRMCY2]|uniref:pyroglutamyl-peptidase I family protein n=1 Tax=Cellulomonas sp. KRMCY2 TaxID=1304865 RepID=UPI00045E69AC|nr:hypothetical protein [Cellulomonas sp. KRMCY2]